MAKISLLTPSVQHIERAVAATCVDGRSWTGRAQKEEDPLEEREFGKSLTPTIRQKRNANTDSSSVFRNLLGQQRCTYIISALPLYV